MLTVVGVDDDVEIGGGSDGCATLTFGPGPSLTVTLSLDKPIFDSGERGATFDGNSFGVEMLSVCTCLRNSPSVNSLVNADRLFRPTS
jgi:hypothetical protein